MYPGCLNDIFLAMVGAYSFQPGCAKELTQHLGVGSVMLLYGHVLLDTVATKARRGAPGEREREIERKRQREREREMT